MDAEYTLTEDDFLKLALHCDRSIPALRWRYTMFRWVVPLVAVAYGIGLTFIVFRGPSSASDKMLGPTFIGMALLLLLVAPKLHEVFTRMNVRTLMRARQDSLLNGPYRLLLMPEELHFTTADSHSGYKWSAILNVTEIPTHYFFWVSQRVALIVPKRAFQTPEQQTEFEQTFQRYRASHALAH